MSAASRRWRHVLVGAVIAGLAVVPAQAFGVGLDQPEGQEGHPRRAAQDRQEEPGRAPTSVVPPQGRARQLQPSGDDPAAQPVHDGERRRTRRRPSAATRSASRSARTALTQGTALNERTVPSATVNLGPSLGTRQVAVGGSLSAVVQFNDTYDGGALGNVSIKILPSTKKFLTTSSVPLLWNDDIADPAKRNDANFLKANSFTTGLSETGINQGCGDFQSSPTYTGGGIVPNGYDHALPRPDADLHARVPDRRRHPRLPVLRPGGSGRDDDAGRLPPELPGRRRDRPDQDRRRRRQQRLDRPEPESVPDRLGPDELGQPGCSAAVQLQRREHGPAHERAAPRDRSGRHLGEHEHRYAGHHRRAADRAGLAGRHARLLRWPGQPVREHPRQERRHRRHREPRDDASTASRASWTRTPSACRWSPATRTRQSSSPATRCGRRRRRTTSRVSA